VTRGGVGSRGSGRGVGVGPTVTKYLLALGPPSAPIFLPRAPRTAERRRWAWCCPLPTPPSIFQSHVKPKESHSQGAEIRVLNNNGHLR
jgi:hypothetical protein